MPSGALRAGLEACVASGLEAGAGTDLAAGADGRACTPTRYLMAALPQRDSDLLLRTGQTRRYQNREYLLRQGEIGDGIHIILSGRVESTHENAHGRELMLATWQSGDFVGAPHVLGEHRHSWSARALGPVTALGLDQSTIRSLLALSPAFAIALIECLGFKGETYSTLAQTLAGQKIGERLALLLVKLCENTAQPDGKDICIGRITQANLARMIGATRQSISLMMGRLQDDGIISTGPSTTIVHDLAALRRSAAD